MAPTIQVFDDRQPVILDGPSGIKPNDWLQDLGTLRQVDYVDLLSTRTGGGVVHLVHFKPQQGGNNLVRGISEGTDLTVWRTPPQPDSTDLTEATGRVDA
jgi:hypothetical protein